MDKTINLATGRLGYSHVEYVASFNGHGTLSCCYSSSHRDDGVRYKSIMLDNHWDVVELGTAIGWTPPYLFMHKQLLMPYDLLGAIKSGLPKSLESRNGWRQRGKWFCSEICAVLIRTDLRFNYSLDPNISPNALYTEVTQWIQRNP